MAVGDWVRKHLKASSREGEGGANCPSAGYVPRAFGENAEDWGRLPKPELVPPTQPVLRGGETK